jgi:hypothetical protein
MAAITDKALLRNVAGLALIAIGAFEYFAGRKARTAKKEQKQSQAQVEREKKQIYKFKRKDPKKKGAYIYYTVNMYTVARTIDDALKGNYFVEDEQRAINAINQVPISYTDKLAYAYADLFSRNLKADLIKYLDKNEVRQIQRHLNAI